jgi:hypothetical protein
MIMAKRKRGDRAKRQTPSTGNSILSKPSPVIKLDPVWSSKRMVTLDGRQVRCMTFDEGSVWIHGLDKLPLLVRRRLADARFNICPTCIDIETRKNGTPNLSLYIAVVDAMERTLDRAEQRFNQTEQA